jgi:hypothetical protein
MDCLTYLETTVRRGCVSNFQLELDEVSSCLECDYQEFCTESMKRNCELNQGGEI